MIISLLILAVMLLSIIIITITGGFSCVEDEISKEVTKFGEKGHVVRGIVLSDTGQAVVVYDSRGLKCNAQNR